jgi:hypothetical protein
LAPCDTEIILLGSFHQKRGPARRKNVLAPPRHSLHSISRRRLIKYLATRPDSRADLLMSRESVSFQAARPNLVISHLSRVEKIPQPLSGILDIPVEEKHPSTSFSLVCVRREGGRKPEFFFSLSLPGDVWRAPRVCAAASQPVRPGTLWKKERSAA